MKVDGFSDDEVVADEEDGVDDGSVTEAYDFVL